MKIRHAYEKHKRYPFETSGVSMTHQSMKEETDMNRIMEKWAKTGVLEHTNRFQGQYGDFLHAPEDYHSAMNAVLDAQEMFLTLPSGVRKRFGNDPGQFLDFVSDPDNREEMQKLGLTEGKPNTAAESLIEGGTEKKGTPVKKKIEKPSAEPENGATAKPDD